MMKITVERTRAQEFQLHKGSPVSPPASDLSPKPSFPRKPPRRKIKTSGAGVLLRREVGASSAKRGSRPETPLLRWKFDEDNAKSNPEEEEKSSPRVGLKNGRRVRTVVSARNLAAGLWRLRLPEFQTNGGQRLGLQSGTGHVSAPTRGHHMDKMHSSLGKDLVHSPHSVSGPKNRHLYKFEPSFQFSNSAMEGVTKWDPVGWNTSDDMRQIFGQPKHIGQRASAAPIISALETELEQARARISELETERRSSKKKLEQFLQKLSEERAAWRGREHEKIRAIIDDMKADLSRERKNRQRLEMVNSKLVNELSDGKLLAKHYMQECEKERKARELIEEVCDELAKEIGEDRAEVEAVKRESMKLQEEVEEERKMLQMAEVWREERVQMKLVDAKVMLEEKYSQMNKLVDDLNTFLKSRSTASDIEELKKAAFLQQVASSVSIEDIRELTYEPPHPDDIFSVFEDVNFGESNEREAEPFVGYTPASHASKIHTVSPEVKILNKDSAQVHSSVFMDQSGELEEDVSEWETVSHAEDQGSSYSPDGSDPSVNKNFRVSNVSRSATDWEKNGGEETPIMEICEVGPVPSQNLKKVSSISRLWRSYPSNGAIMSPDHGSGKSGLSPPDVAGQWSSPDTGNPQVTRGMKGCIEWPRGAPKSSLKARLLEARIESQKIQLRQVLKQKI